jgi:aminoglycoside phosphotransferase (APT) family kinase protein
MHHRSQRSVPHQPSSETRLGALIKGGCDADVFEFGPTAVLRRPRDGRDLRQERALMQYLYEAGFPVPYVFEHDDPTAIVMERVGGPSMRSDMNRRPWMLYHHVRTLADLACQLGDIRAPDWLSVNHGPGDSVVHLDLSTGNVIISDRGPIVIDWGNARRGGRRLDAAYTWLCWKASMYSGSYAARLVKRAVRIVSLRLFEHRVDFSEILAHLPEAARFRFADPTLTAIELQLTERVLKKVGMDKPCSC